MILCYFVLAHHKPEQFEKLLAALNDPRDTFLVHVNARTDEATRSRFREVVERHPNVELLPPEPVYWGHWSLARQFGRAIDAALRRPGWDYLVVLSGQCFPIKPKAEIRRHLGNPEWGWPDGATPGPWPNYLSLDPIEGSKRAAAFRRRFRFFWFEFADRLWPVPAWRRPPAGIDFRWKGAPWGALHRDLCEWLQGDPLPARIRHFLRRSKNPDEFLLQWCIMSSPFRETLRPALHYIRWRPGSAHPDVLSADDLREIVATDFLFARKIDFDQDEGMVGLLENDFGRGRRPVD